MKLKAVVRLVTIQEREIVIDIDPREMVNAEALFRQAAREQYGNADRVEVCEMDFAETMAKAA